MIITISGNDIEYHSSEQLFGLGVRQNKGTHGLENAFITVSTYLLEIHMIDGAPALNMDLSLSGHPVKAPGHKMSPFSFFQQTAFGHFNPAIPGH